MANHRKTHEQFLQESNAIYGPDKFIYLTQYQTARTPIRIKCVACGREWTKVPNQHLQQPHGCQSCAQVTNRCSKFSSIQHEIMEGLIISDGSIYRQKLKRMLSTPIFGFKNIQKEIVDFCETSLPLEFARHTDPPRDFEINGIIGHSGPIDVIQSNSDHGLVPYWERWYNGKAKHIPKDFVLTPRVARFWFYGDGSSSAYNDGKKVNIRFCTNSFTQSDCERLCEMWKAIGINFYPASTPTGPVLTLGIAQDIISFFEYMGEPELECFRYKWKRPIL